jgi:hypothetical protein
MKTRIGFVSNSSSSSFIVAVKSDMSFYQIASKVKRLFSVPEGHPLSKISELAAHQVMDGIHEGKLITTKQQIVDEWGPYETLKDAEDDGFKLFKRGIGARALKCLDEGFKVFLADFYNDADVDLTQAPIDVETPDFVLMSEG